MSFAKKFAAAGALASLAAMIPQVSAHGTVTGLVVDGTYYGGYIVDTYNYETDPPAVIGWSEDATDNGYVSDYTSADIICHKDAKNAQLSATIAAGKDITFEWTDWPESHHGPVITYLADCGDSCETVDKTTLEFVKFDATGLVDDTTVPGTWGSDQLIANNNSWTVTVPSSLKAGNYVLRHEIIALHSAGQSGGAQNYPQCINIEVTGSGTESPTGTLGESLYTASDAGILVNIYESLTYTIPGPAIPAAFSGSSSGSSAASSVAASTSAVATSSVAASSSAVATTSAVASSVVATTSSAATSVAASTTAASSTVASTTAALVASSSVAASSETTAAASATTLATTTTAAVSSALASSVASAISSLETDLPSSVLTSAAPTATATTSSGSTVSTAGLTVAELLDLLKQILVQLFASSTSTSSKARRHARDIVAA